MKLSQRKCLEILEEVVWKKKPQCPYCTSFHATPLKKEKRYRCNSCHTAYSVTVNTLFHDTRLPLEKWFNAILILLDSDEKVSSRKLAVAIGVNKNTAWYLIQRIEDGISRTQDRQLILSILEKLRK